MSEYNCNTTFHLDSGDLPGQFLYIREVMQKNVAKEKCEEKGLVLAPVKSQTTIVALKKHFDECSENMDTNVALLLIGLEGEENKIVFSDGEAYNEKVHGSLFKKHYKPKNGTN